MDYVHIQSDCKSIRTLDLDPLTVFLLLRWITSIYLLYVNESTVLSQLRLIKAGLWYDCVLEIE